MQQALAILFFLILFFGLLWSLYSRSGTPGISLFISAFVFVVLILYFLIWWQTKQKEHKGRQAARIIAGVVLVGGMVLLIHTLVCPKFRKIVSGLFVLAAYLTALVSCAIYLLMKKKTGRPASQVLPAKPKEVHNNV